ncbi:MAG: nucleotidyltransferase domain-containing protein [Pseudomonadota bacterium]
MEKEVIAQVAIATTIINERFPTASTCFLAGSVVKGEATASSDLDLVVIFDRVERANRQSFVFSDWPVEAFVHDPQTLKYFFCEVDRLSGFPALPTMVSEGIEVPSPTTLGQDLKDLASHVLQEGPPTWSQEERDRSRYMITDMVDDIRAPRNPDELRVVLSDLYSALANHYFRSRNLWSAKGKSVPRTLASHDSLLHERFAKAFAVAFKEETVSSVIRLCEDVLAPDGGFLFEGYSRDAPDSWRS